MKTLVLLSGIFVALHAHANFAECNGEDFSVRLSSSATRETVVVRGTEYVVKSFDVEFPKKGSDGKAPGPIALKGFTTSTGLKVGMKWEIPRRRVTEFNTEVFYNGKSHKVSCKKSKNFAFAK